MVGLHGRFCLEVKVSDIEYRINSQIDQIRQECTQICATSQPDYDIEKYEKIIRDKDLEIEKLKMSLNQVSERNDEVLHSYRKD